MKKREIPGVEHGSALSSMPDSNRRGLSGTARRKRKVSRSRLAQKKTVR